VTEFPKPLSEPWVRALYKVSAGPGKALILQ